ncbi:MAG TPA: hypothetical protein VE441_09540 [Mycobacterium sp.]|jgi:hypothetical protein|nr:hypothetical protein [Mycobacterium sp.]
MSYIGTRAEWRGGARALTLSDPDHDASLATVTIDLQGTALAVWSGSDGTNLRAQAAERPAGGTWAPPVTVSAAAHDPHDPQVAVDPRGDAVVAWNYYDGNHQQVQAARRLNGGSWSTAITLSAAGRMLRGVPPPGQRES